MNMNERVIDQGSGIVTIDTGYQRKGLVASHLVEQGDHYAFVDVGTSSCLQQIRDVMQVMAIKPEQVKYIMVTHVHLDHSGAAGVLMRECPEAQLVVHPRGARHMIDPAKLIAGATAVYGEEMLKKTFGEIIPVEADRVIEVVDEQVLSLNGRQLLFLDTPGHARHHYCVYDEVSNGFFTGDTFGLAYAPLAVDGESFIFPTTTPIQFDPAALLKSIKRLISFNPEKMYLTHFGCVYNPDVLAEHLMRQVEAFVDIAQSVKHIPEQNCHEHIYHAMKQLLLQNLQDFGCKLSEGVILECMEMDLQLNTQGLCYWIQDVAKK